jgi:soluble lytic murein transglycosylase-like protein
MSIESVNARIAQIEARIQGLSPQRAEPSALPEVAPNAAPTPTIEPGKPFLDNGTPTVKPFDVALAQMTGQARLRPVTGKPASEIDALIDKYSTQNGLDAKLVRAVIKAESDGNPQAVSHKGAMGLMQLMPAELKGYGVTDPFDPEQNIAGGTRQLAEKLKLFKGDLSLALAAYNAGSGNVRKYGGIPPFTETRNYVKKIMGMLGGEG